jgi:hypothetical protein
MTARCSPPLDQNRFSVCGRAAFGNASSAAGGFAYICNYIKVLYPDQQARQAVSVDMFALRALYGFPGTPIGMT